MRVINLFRYELTERDEARTETEGQRGGGGEERGRSGGRRRSSRVKSPTAPTLTHEM